MGFLVHQKHWALSTNTRKISSPEAALEDDPRYYADYKINDLGWNSPKIKHGYRSIMSQPVLTQVVQICLQAVESTGG